MITILAFIITIAGGINWLLIGLLQYDFVAGIFGYQGSIFSRLIYIIVGAASIILVWKMIAGKGVINIFSRRNKKNLEKQLSKLGIEKGKYSPTEQKSVQEESHFGQAEAQGITPTQESEPSDGGGLISEHFENKQP